MADAVVADVVRAGHPAPAPAPALVLVLVLVLVKAAAKTVMEARYVAAWAAPMALVTLEEVVVAATAAEATDEARLGGAPGAKACSGGEGEGKVGGEEMGEGEGEGEAGGEGDADEVVWARQTAAVEATPMEVVRARQRAAVAATPMEVVRVTQTAAMRARRGTEVVARVTQTAAVRACQMYLVRESRGVGWEMGQGRRFRPMAVAMAVVVMTAACRTGKVDREKEEGVEGTSGLVAPTMAS